MQNEYCFRRSFIISLYLHVLVHITKSVLKDSYTCGHFAQIHRYFLKDGCLTTYYCRRHWLFPLTPPRTGPLQCPPGEISLLHAPRLQQYGNIFTVSDSRKSQIVTTYWAKGRADIVTNCLESTLALAV